MEHPEINTKYFKYTLYGKKQIRYEEEMTDELENVAINTFESKHSEKKI